MYPHIRSLKVQNFKGIAELDLTLDKSLTVLAGVNGVGKTSVLQAVLGIVTRVWDVPWKIGEGSAKFDPPGTLVRYGASEGMVTAELALNDDLGISAKARVQPKELDLLPVSGNTRVLAEQKLSLPLIVYYDQSRIGGLTDARGRWDKKKSNRTKALNTTPHALSDFKDWFFEKEGDEAREARERVDLGYADPEVEAVQKVVETVAGKAAKLRSRKPAGDTARQLFMRKKDGVDIPFEALSGGEQAFFLLAVDLARRLILEIPGHPIDEAPGIVCIDEIELHLHPAWQREILTKLMTLFSECQFLVSTHSPQVIGSVAAEHVRLLTADDDGRVKVTQPVASRGRDSNYVLEGILETPEQDPEVDRLFDRFDELIDADQFDDADRILDQLNKLIEGGSPQITVRRAKCRRLRRTAG